MCDASVEHPRILVFSTETISDPGIDLAGASHMHYSPTVLVITVPCSSCIKPGWVLHAVEQGFDGVFIAADGEDCAALSNCTKLTGAVVKAAQKKLKEKGYNARRLKMAAICSVCAESFVSHMANFSKALVKLNEKERSAA